MPREYEGYRTQIERINGIFPNRLTLKVKEVAFLENKDPRTVRDMYHFYGGQISVDAYVRALCRKYEGKEPVYWRRKK